MFKEMRQADIKPLREKIWIMNGKKCPVLGKVIRVEDTALDHIHKRKDEEYSINAGTIRTTLDFRVNAVLGKLENSIKRTGLHNDPDFNISEFLRNAADYFEATPYNEDGLFFIHPSEVNKEPPVSKRNYNILRKAYINSGKRAKFPEYPKSKKLTIKLKKLFAEFNIEAFNN